MEVGNITKGATFKSFLHLSYKNIELLFLWTALFNIFTRQTLPDGFWLLHKNMNCMFPLNVTVNDFLVDPSPIKKEGILNIHQYLMVRNNIKKYLGLLKRYT